MTGHILNYFKVFPGAAQMNHVTDCEITCALVAFTRLRWQHSVLHI